MKRIDQMQARKVGVKFIEQNAADDRFMAIAEFGGSLQIKIGAGYIVVDKTTNKEVCFTGLIPLDDFIQKGNSMVPFTLMIRVSDWPPRTYRLVLLAQDGANNQAPQKETEFTVSD
jgi:hypothetical protein